MLHSVVLAVGLLLGALPTEAHVKTTQAEYTQGRLKTLQSADGKQIQVTQYHWNQPQIIEYPDHLERPLAASDESGNATWQALSESFGKTYIEQGSATQINLRLPGQYWDAETGTHYNQQRDYDPDKGRYIQIDPLGLYDGVNNTYAYAGNEPTAYVDPTGELFNFVVQGGFAYGRCVVACKATDALLAAVKSECDPRTLGDCAKECLNPFNWFGGARPRR